MTCGLDIRSLPFAQPVAAVWCLRAAGEKRLLPAICIAVISLCIPAWWNRFGHAALTGHFVLLLALGSYFHPSRHGDAMAGALVLNVVALLVHPYLFFMTSAILLAVPMTALARPASSCRARTRACGRRSPAVTSVAAPTASSSSAPPIRRFCRKRGQARRHLRRARSGITRVAPVCRYDRSRARERPT